MAVAQVRPSKWTYFFFGGLALTLVGRVVWSKREQREFVHDAPVAHTTRRLLRCLVGRDVQRMLGDRTTAQASQGNPGWGERIEDRLRRFAAQSNDEWPARCVPMAERLEARLGIELHAQRAQRAAMDVRQYLATAATRRIEWMRVVESGDLANALGTLAYEVSGLTSAAEEGWTSPLQNAPTDLYPVQTVSFPHARAVAAGGDSAALVMPDLLVYQSVGDRRLHRVTFDANETPTDRDMGRGAPVANEQRAGTVLVASNEGDSLFVPTAEPSPLVALPEPVRRGVERVDGWSTASTDDSLAWVDVSDGIVRVRATPRSGEVQWRDVGSFGAPDLVFGVVALRGASEQIQLASFDRGANSLSLSVRHVPLDGTASPEDVSHPGGEWLTFDPHMRVCESDGARHVLLHDAFGVRAVRFDTHGGIATQDMRFDRLGALASRRFEWHCNDDHALLFADFEQRNEAMLVFDYGEAAPHLVRAPSFGHNPHTTGAALTRDRLVVTVANDNTVRAFDAALADTLFVAEDAYGTWTGGSLLALVEPGRREGDARSMQVVTMIGHGDQVALLATVREGPRTYVGRLASRDDGRTFRGD